MSQDFYGGGGFTNSPFSGSVDGSPSSGARRDITHSLTPVFISQLHKASQAHADAEWKLDDAPVGQVTLVGHVAEIRKQSSHITYKFEDQLGTIEARTWSEGSEDDEDKWGVQVHGYARVVGTLKSFGGKRYINATHLRPCHDSNEFYFHIFEVISVHLTRKFGPPMTNPNNIQTSGGAVAKASDYSASKGPSGGNNNENTAWANLSPLQQRILRAIVAQPDHDVSGAFVGNIAKAVGGDADAISNALDQLMDGGHIYTTSDDSHFAVST
ncbi:Replication factor A protein 2 [Marasmius tenuissimus]|uniref:Replication factor A protein 2 n=1 Tax=Marasmius tenuissimus TaxID=585030 RepID=A0ABR3ACN8_9AGAR|nr:Replication factor A protein 2 [Marasmius tenuissimus]